MIARWLWRALVAGCAGAGISGAGLAVAQPSGLPLAGEIDGVVEDAHGRAVAGADIIVTRPDGSARRVAVSNANGRFALTAGDAGTLRLMIITWRGARVASRLLEVAPGTRVSLLVRDAPASSGATAAPEISPPAHVRLNGVNVCNDTRDPCTSWALPALARNSDLGSAITALPGSAAAAAPAGGPVLAGLPLAEVPVLFEGFALGDPIDGDVPAALPLALLGSVTVASGPTPLITLRAPLAETTGGEVTATAALTTAARGADGVARPLGVTGGWDTSARLDLVGQGGSARATLAIAPQSHPWQADPQSPANPRGLRLKVLPALAWGEWQADAWQLRGGALLVATERAYGRSGSILGPTDPQDQVDHGRRWLLVGTSAQRALGPGANSLGLSAGVLRTHRSDVPAGSAPTKSEGMRGSLAATVQLAFALGGEHQTSAGVGLDIESATTRGLAASRQAGLLISEASAHAVIPWVDLADRFSPTAHFEMEAGLRVAGASLGGDSTLQAGAPVIRSFASDVLLAPRVRFSWRPFGLGFTHRRGLGLHAWAGRTPGAVPLGALLGATTGPRGGLPLPAQEALALRAEFEMQSGHVGLVAQARREAHVIEDLFAAVSGKRELFSPGHARRDFRALGIDAGYRRAWLRGGVSAVLARLSGNHLGYVDEATGRLQPWSTPAFDGPDVEVNRSGPLPFDRPYGLRAFAIATAAPSPLWSLIGTARGRLDAGTPLSATGRSAASGSGQVFLVPRGSVGRTRTHTSFDLSLRAGRSFGRTAASVTLEAFGLAWRRPIVTRSAQFSDAAVTPEAAAGVSPESGYGRPVAYAEPLLLRLRAGVAF